MDGIFQVLAYFTDLSQQIHSVSARHSCPSAAQSGM